MYNISENRIKWVISISLLIVTLNCTVPGVSYAWNQSGIKWRTIETPHFDIHYHDNEELIARETAKIAEEVYSCVTEFYPYEPGSKVHINIFDKEDVTHGASYYYLNRIDISASELYFPFRGTANWLRNVFTHEFIHIVSIQYSMKMPRWIPSLYIQGISFEKEKRPDVITGYPNFQGSIPVAGEVMPNWFAEGLAQFQCECYRNDIWDSHRDMLLRTAVLNDDLLTLDEMGVFGKNSLKSEMVYNQGFSMVRFIADRYGDEKLVELAGDLAKIYRIKFDGACRSVLGISSRELFGAWRMNLKQRYAQIEERIGVSKRKGEFVGGRGFINMYPSSDEQGNLYYMSNRGGDYLGLSLVRDGGNSKEVVIAGNVFPGFDISRSNNKFCYAKRTGKNPSGLKINDIFEYDPSNGKERRLTRSKRVTSPVWSPDAGRIACIKRGGGCQRILIIDLDNGTSRYLTDSSIGRQYFGLSWGSGGILADCFDGVSRDIILLDPERGDMRKVLGDAADERDPCWDRDGDGFFYSSDRTGIFNVYYHDMEGCEDLQLTDCIGGAFNPSPLGNDLLFSAYHSNGYEIRKLKNWKGSASKADRRNDSYDLLRRRRECIGDEELTTVGYGIENSGDSKDRATEEGDVETGKSFGISYSDMFIFPAFMVYDGEPRIALSLNTGDILDRQDIFASGSIGTDKEFDLAFRFETRQFKPTLSLEVYRTRKYHSQSAIDYGRRIDYKTRFDLWDAFIKCCFEFIPPGYYSRKEITLQYNHGEYGLNIEAWQLYSQELGWNYYRGDEISLMFRYKNIKAEIDGDINPRSGRSLYVELTRAYNKLHKSSDEFEYSFRPKYRDNYFWRYFLTYEEYIPLPLWRHALSVHVQAGALDRDEIDSFFYLYAGSRDGLRGYSYYSIGGSKLAMARLNYRFPLLMNINKQISLIYIQSIYAGVFADAGDAWSAETPELSDIKRNVGLELRLKGFTFYSYPLAASMEAAYGLDDITYNDPFYETQTYYEGKTWKFYGSILFSF